MANRRTKVEELLEMARKGPVRAKDLARANIPRAYLRRLVDQRLLERVERGVYRLVGADVTELASVVEVAAHVPQVIICLLSALEIHELGTEVPHKVWVMVDRNRYPPKLESQSLEVVYASGDALTTGVETRMIEGTKVRITTPTKTVADCFRYRNRVGLEVALEALRDYLRNRRGKVDDLVDAAKADRVYSVMRPYIEALV